MSKKVVFEELTIGTKLFFRGVPRTVNYLNNMKHNGIIGFNESLTNFSFYSAVENLSYEAPKQKVKAYLYSTPDGVITCYFYSEKKKYNFNKEEVDQVKGMLDAFFKTDLYIEVME